jgi:hypothetical protein
MYYNYFRTLASDMFESARIDGASELRIAFSIAFPVCRSLSVDRLPFRIPRALVGTDVGYADGPGCEDADAERVDDHPVQAHGQPARADVCRFGDSDTPVVVLFLIFSRNFKEGIAMQFK